MLRDLIEYIALSLVDEQEAVRVDERRRGDLTVLVLSVAQEDVGRVIGKEGRIAMAMRGLLHVAGAHSDRQAVLEVR